MICERMIRLASGGSAIRARFEEGKRLASLYGADNVFDFSIGNPYFAPPNCVKDAIVDIITNDDPMSVHGYPANAGFPAVRQAVAESLNRKFGTDYNSDNIIMTVGAAGEIIKEYDFSPVSVFWITASVLSFLIPVIFWKKLKAKGDEDLS